MSALRVIVPALLLLVTVTAWAKPPSPEKAAALEEYAKGEELFGAGKFDAAATRFKAAFDHYPDPAYLFNIATCYERAVRWPLAIRYYDMFLEKAPDSPAADRVRGLRDAAVKAREARRVTIKLVTDPPGATASVSAPSGDTQCETPCTVKTDPGAISIMLTLGSVVRKLQKTLAPSATWDTKVSMAAADSDPTGTLVIDVDVIGAMAQVGGRIVASGAKVRLPVGVHKVIVTHKDYKSWTSKVDVGLGKVTTVSVQLNPASEGRTQKVAGWITMGAGGVLLVGGVVSGALALTAFDNAKDLENGPFTAKNELEFEKHKDKADTRALAADVTLGLAAAALTTGLVLWLTAD